MANEVLLTNKIFLNAALPLLKVIANDVPSLAKKFEKIHCIYQVSHKYFQYLHYDNVHH